MTQRSKPIPQASALNPNYQPAVAEAPPAPTLNDIQCGTHSLLSELENSVSALVARLEPVLRDNVNAVTDGEGHSPAPALPSALSSAAAANERIGRVVRDIVTLTRQVAV